METPMARADQGKLADPRIDCDRLSSLPDEILSDILSFLGTKYAVGTSILSRRWKDVWTRVSNVDLVDSQYVDRPKGPAQEPRDLVFSRLVDKVLSQHKNLNSLRRLRLRFSMDSKFSSSFWSKIELDSACELEEMDVHNSYKFMRGLPDSLYTLKNLKVLKLDFVKMEPLHGSVFLPSVKILQLLGVKIKYRESLARLFSGCPVLETLGVEYCYSPISDKNENYILTASLPYVKNLTIVSDGGYDSALRAIVIEAPSLEHLHLEDFEEFQFLGSRPLSCLVSARVEIGWRQEHPLIGFLTQISNAKEMWMSWRILSRLTVLLGDVQLPVFPKLTHLTLQCGRSRRVLLSFLNSASQLQSLVLHMGNGLVRPHWKESELARTPECLLSSLEEIEIDVLAAFEDEMKMVAYFLKAGVVLRKANIHVVNINLDIKNRKVLPSLLKLPRGSSAFEAHFFLSNDEIHIDNNNEDGFTTTPSIGRD